MNTTELRAKYGDPFNRTANLYTYPDHFFCPWDDFTIHIKNWEMFLTRFYDIENLKFLELGTAQGRASVWMMENVLTATNCHLTTIDLTNIRMTHGEKQKRMLDDQEIVIDCLQNLQPYIDRNQCTFVQTSTDDFFRTNQQRFDFIYIDASHDPDQVLRDAIKSFDCVKQNGLILFDDYGWGECGLGIEAFLQAFNKKINVIHKDYQVLVEKR